jgi:hypothetical protein
MGLENFGLFSSSAIDPLTKSSGFKRHPKRIPVAANLGPRVPPLSTRKEYAQFRGSTGSETVKANLVWQRTGGCMRWPGTGSISETLTSGEVSGCPSHRVFTVRKFWYPCVSRGHHSVNHVRLARLRRPFRRLPALPTAQILRSHYGRRETVREMDPASRVADARAGSGVRVRRVPAGRVAAGSARAHRGLGQGPPLRLSKQDAGSRKATGFAS